MALLFSNLLRVARWGPNRIMFKVLDFPISFAKIWRSWLLRNTFAFIAIWVSRSKTYFNTMSPFLYLLSLCIYLITISSSNNTTFDCTGDDGFCNRRNPIMNCANDKDCYLYCDQTNCQDSTINCPSTNHSCNIVCSSNGQSPCQNLIIS